VAEKCHLSSHFVPGSATCRKYFFDANVSPPNKLFPPKMFLKYSLMVTTNSIFLMTSVGTIGLQA